MSSSSVFVSCADYDDDINANKAEIVAAQNEIAKLSSSLSALETELKTTKTNLESQLSTLESTFKTQIADAEGRLNAAIAAKADQTTVDNLIKEVNDLKTAYEANKAAVQAKLDAIDKDIAAIQDLLAKKADQSALDAAIQTLTAAINGKVDKETYNEAVARISALETLLNSLKSDIETLRADKAALADVNSKVELINKDIAALQEALKDKVSTEAFNSLKATVEGLQTTLTNVQAAFQAALATKADQATVDALKADVQSKIDALNEQLKNYVTNDTFNAAVSRLETLIAALENSKADKTEVAALQATLLTVQAAVADLQANKADKEAVNAALESLRKEVEALVASKADKTEIVRLDNLIEKLEALVIAKEAAIYNEMDVREAAIQALIAALETNKADRTELEAAKTSLENALKEAVDKLNEDIATKYAELNGRIDKAFEELEGIRKDIVGILADLAAATGEIDRVEKKFDKLILDLQEADKTLDGKIAALEGIVNGHIEAYEIAMKALNQQVAALEAFQKKMEETVIPGLKEDLKNASDALQEQINKEVEERQAAITQVMTEIQKTNSDIATKYAELKQLIADGDAAAEEKIGKLDERVKELETQFAKIDQKIADAIAANVENIMVYVSHVLKSISLVPQLYIGGIEAIEFTALTYDPLEPGTSGLGTSELHARLKANEKAIRVDNGTAEAYYTLSPANVDRKTIDEDKIVYKSAIADTRATTPYLGTETPVAFNGIAEWGVKGQPGLIKVNLKKTITGSLNLNGGNGQEYGGEVYIVNLNVPRKTQEVAGVEVDKDDKAMITSENHMLVENEFTPKIAYLPWGNTEQVMQWGGLNGDQDLDNYRYHHFTDSVTMWRQRVDFDAANDKYHMVYKQVVYNQTLNVRDMVTGCFHWEGTPKDETNRAGIQYKHDGTQMSKDQLKTYGLTFRFAIPTKEYKQDVDHSTDQQQFAKIDAVTGIVESKLPLGRTDNRACVGKEPIIRIMLIDTVNNKLVDERYMKIKWVELKKQPVTLKPYDVETSLVPCAVNKSIALTWKHVIEEIYANVAPEGMSQKTFEQIYLSNDKPVTFSPVKRYWKYSYTLPYGNISGTTASQLSLLSPAVAENGPEIDLTTNEQGDAVIAKWELDPNQIANIYPYQQKTFVSTLTFHSILPTEYPDLNMDWIWTVKLPSLPEINGYYDDYWFTQYTLYDVMAVQYGTAQYFNIKNGTIIPGKEYGIDAPAVGMQLYDKANNSVEPGTDYCVFYNAITNAFTYEQKNNLPQFIVKKLNWDCSTWDMQFTWPAVDAIEGQLTWKNDKWSGSAKNYFHLKSQGGNKTNPNIKDNKVWTDNFAAKTYPQMAGYRPASNTNSPALSKINWKTAGAYKLETTAGKQALQLEWWGMMELNKDGIMTGNFDQADGEHVAWDNITKDGRKPYNYAMLYADHHNAANQALLNPIVPKGIGIEPDRTHDKKVHMGVWGTINDWNIVPVKDFDFCLVEPLAINADLGGAFEEGYISGTVVRSDDAFHMTDFRGYEVSMADPEANATEWTKYRQALYKYYEVQEPVWDLANVRYGMKVVNGSVKVDDNLTYAQAMTAGQISLQTNGNVVLSIDDPVFNGVKYLRFKNNQGSNVELPFWVYIPVTAEYGFGKVSMQSKVRVYPKYQVPEGVVITPYPGPLED